MSDHEHAAQAHFDQAPSDQTTGPLILVACLGLGAFLAMGNAPIDSSGLSNMSVDDRAAETPALHPHEVDEPDAEAAHAAAAAFEELEEELGLIDKDEGRLPEQEDPASVLMNPPAETEGASSQAPKEAPAPTPSSTVSPAVGSPAAPSTPPSVPEKATPSARSGEAASIAKGEPTSPGTAQKSGKAGTAEKPDTADKPHTADKTAEKKASTPTAKPTGGAPSAVPQAPTAPPSSTAPKTPAPPSSGTTSSPKTDASSKPTPAPQPSTP